MLMKAGISGVLARYSVLASIAGAALISTGARAADEAPPAGAQYKIGVVEVKKVFDEYQKQKDQYAELESKRETLQKPIDDLSKQITADQDQYKKDKEKLAPDAKRALEEKIEANVTRYKAEFDRAQQDIDRAQKKLGRDLFEEIYGAIQEVGAQGNYHLILNAGDITSVLPNGSAGVIYHSTTLNMTQKVIDYLNEKYKTKKK